MSWSWARRGTSLPRPGLGPRAGLQSPGERRVGKMYQRVCLLGPRFPEQLSPVSTMLSHLPRVSREGNYFAHILNWRILVPGPHNEELGAPVANPAERKGGTEMREKITGTLGAIWCCCRPKSRTDFSKITGFIERHEIEKPILMLTWNLKGPQVVNWFLTRMPRLFNGERNIFSTSGFGRSR
ncbi:uncharacterized protein LOC117199207 isoform X2 [Orcinus orca]|uniref:uncharacterized protein LOC117199207 isoform X2 n=1 Tax=Orcinus orca TaxID=9733 RepID=UPI002112F25D|nr:uncharacterized protein LOC117199207 isoform X2 [Orcinus orca]